MHTVTLKDGTEAVLMRVGSNRAGRKLTALLGCPVEYWFTLWDGNNMAGVPLGRVEEARNITGISFARSTREPMRCWTW